MADLHELIETVQVTLASTRTPEPEELNQIHNELDAEIRKTNKRLRECDSLLAGGHRSEAIQLAEQEPQLLEVVTILDFPELPEWNDFVAELGLTVTPELLMDIAADINHAYSEDAPLERYLRRLRVYSLGRAPLKTRIGLLRKIAKVDPGNAGWEEDLKSYEEARLRQIVDEYREADANDDHGVIFDLAEELHSGKWLFKPSAKLVQSVDKSAAALSAVDAMARLWDVLEELRLAHAAGEVDRAITLVAQWNDLLGTCDQSTSEYKDLRATAIPILQWVREQQEAQAAQQAFDENVQWLRRAIKTPGRSLASLQSRYRAVADNTQFDLPPEVHDEYQNAIDVFERRRKAKLMAAGGGVLAVLIIIVVLVIAYS